MSLSVFVGYVIWDMGHLATQPRGRGEHLQTTLPDGLHSSLRSRKRHMLPNFTPLVRPCLISDRKVELLSTFIFIIGQLSGVGGLKRLDPGYARPSPFWHLPPVSLVRPPASTLQPVVLHYFLLLLVLDGLLVFGIFCDVKFKYWFNFISL